jgi:hypothetical protein
VLVEGDSVDDIAAMAALLRLHVTRNDRRREDVLLTGFPTCRGGSIVMLYADGSTDARLSQPK